MSTSNQAAWTTPTTAPVGQPDPAHLSPVALRALETFTPVMRWETLLDRIGISKETGLKWRKLGILAPDINIAGRNYVSRERLAEFIQKAKSGQFAKTSHFTKGGHRFKPVLRP